MTNKRTINKRISTNIFQIIVIILVFAFVAFTGCDKNKPQPTQQEFEKMALKAVENPLFEVYQTIYDDFDNNGTMEAFVLLVNADLKTKQNKFALFFATQKRVKRLKTLNAGKEASIKTINGIGYKHVLLDIHDVSNDKALIYAVNNKKSKLIFRCNTFGTEIVDDTVKIIVKNYAELCTETTADTTIKQWLNASKKEIEIKFDKEARKYICTDPADADFDFEEHHEIVKNINTYIRPTCKYTFYDFDKDGYDELAIKGIKNGICTLKKNRLQMIAAAGSSKEILYYPNENIVFTRDHLGLSLTYEKFYRILGKKAKTIAYKYIEHFSTSNGFVKHKGCYGRCYIVYEINDKEATYAQYMDFENAMEKKKTIEWKDLDWKKLPQQK